MAITFDGPNKIVHITAVGTYDCGPDIYSPWKEWAALSDNLKYLPAFDTTGGDPVGGGQEVAPYYFIRNDLGWIIKAPEADGLIVLEGNLFPRDATQQYVVEPDGDFTVLVRQQVSTQAIVVTTGSGVLPADITDIATEVWAYERT